MYMEYEAAIVKSGRQDPRINELKSGNVGQW